MDERRKWKKVNNEEGGNNHRRLKKELKRASGKAKKKCLESLCGEIVEFLGTGLYDLTCLKRKEIGRKESYYSKHHRRLSRAYNFISETFTENLGTEYYTALRSK